MTLTIAANGASISITIFVLAITGFLYLLPFILDFLRTSFSKNDFLNLILRRSCWVIATYLMMLNSAIMATLVNQAGLGLEQEMFRYMFLFGLLGYILMFYLAFITLIDVLYLWNIKKWNKRMGEHD